LAAMKANRPDSHPASLDTDIANLNVSFSDARRAFVPSAFDAVRAKVVRL